MALLLILKFFVDIYPVFIDYYIVIYTAALRDIIVIVVFVLDGYDSKKQQHQHDDN